VGCLHLIIQKFKITNCSARIRLKRKINAPKYLSSENKHNMQFGYNAIFLFYGLEVLQVNVQGSAVRGAVHAVPET